MTVRGLLGYGHFPNIKCACVLHGQQARAKPRDSPMMAVEEVLLFCDTFFMVMIISFYPALQSSLESLFRYECCKQNH